MQIDIKNPAEVWDYLNSLPAGKNEIVCSPADAARIKKIIWDYSSMYIKNGLTPVIHATGRPIVALSNPRGITANVSQHDPQPYKKEYAPGRKVDPNSYAGKIKECIKLALNGGVAGFDPEGRLPYARLIVANYNLSNGTQLGVHTVDGECFVTDRNQSQNNGVIVPYTQIAAAKASVMKGYTISEEDYAAVRADMQGFLNALKQYIA